jgi:hypothetical protein
MPPEQLELTRLVTDDDESDLPELADTGDTAGDCDFLIRQFVEPVMYLVRIVCTVRFGRVWVDTELLQII